jgi:methionine-rich copper-binding protein CopC
VTTEHPPDQTRSHVRLLGGPRNTKILLLRSEGSSTDVLSYKLPSLPPGRYEAQWRAVADDGHVTEGVLTFTVK